MMKLVFIAVFLIIGCIAAPQDVHIVQYNNEHYLDSYNFAFQTSDGTYRAENGQLKNPGTENEALAVSGTFQFIAPDGVTYTVNYVADENGFQPSGDHIPKFPKK